MSENPRNQEYYCHKCRVRFSNTAQTHICPRCSDGFIEPVGLPITNRSNQQRPVPRTNERGPRFAFLFTNDIIYEGAFNVSFDTNRNIAFSLENLTFPYDEIFNSIPNPDFRPLPSNLIAKIPIVNVTAEQVALKLQCSICFDDFLLGECVKQLFCRHVFHEQCIRRWLEINATCPVCRLTININNYKGNVNNFEGDEDNVVAPVTLIEP